MSEQELKDWCRGHVAPSLFAKCYGEEIPMSSGISVLLSYAQGLGVDVTSMSLLYGMCGYLSASMVGEVEQLCEQAELEAWLQARGL